MNEPECMCLSVPSVCLCPCVFCIPMQDKSKRWLHNETECTYMRQLMSAMPTGTLVWTRCNTRQRDGCKTRQSAYTCVNSCLSCPQVPFSGREPADERAGGRLQQLDQLGVSVSPPPVCALWRRKTTCVCTHICVHGCVYIYTYMYINIHVYIYIYIHIYLHISRVRIYIYIYVYWHVFAIRMFFMCISPNTDMYIYAYIHMYVCKCILIYVRLCVYICVCI